MKYLLLLFLIMAMNLSLYSQTTDEINLQLNNHFISEVVDVVDSVIIITVDGYKKHSYTYNDNGKWVVDLHGVRWNGDGSWLNIKNQYNYDENGFLVSVYYGCVEHITPDPSRPWERTEIAVDSCSRDTYEYDNNGNRILKLIERRKDTTWLGYMRQTYTYDGNGNRISILYENGYDTNWVNSWRQTYTYNGNGNRISILHENWYDTNWVNNLRETYTYDSNGNVTFMLREKWLVRNWANDMRYTYTYDSKGNIALKLAEFYSRGWQDAGQEIYSYDSNGNMTLVLSEGREGYFSFRDAVGNYYSFRGLRIEVYYKEITDVSKNSSGVLNYTLSQNYPNPFNPTTTINYTLPQSGLVQLKLYDVLGREVETLVNKGQVRGNYKVELNAKSLTSGIYFYKLQSGNFAETKKLILLR